MKTDSKTYKHGAPFDKTLCYNIIDVHKRINIGKASMILIDGGIGEGKTTLGVEVAEEYQKAPLDLKNQLAMGGKEFQEKLKICIEKEYNVIIYDEAGDFNRRGSLTSFNQDLNRIFETYRTYQILVILCLPQFDILDNSLFQKQIPRLLLHCENRTTRQGNYRGYSLYRMFYLKSKMKKLVVPPQAYTLVRPNFFGHFLNLTPARSDELSNLSTEGKKKILETNIIKNRGLMSASEVGGKIGRSKSWVNVKIKKLGLTAQHVYKKQKYYTMDDINIIREEL